MPTDVNEESLGLRGGLRALMRELAASVYASVASLFVAGWLPSHFAVQLAVDALFVGGAGALLARVGDGPAWTSHLVGLFAALLQLVVVVVLPMDEAEQVAWSVVAARLVVVGVAGAAGARLARRRSPKVLENKAIQGEVEVGAGEA